MASEGKQERFIPSPSKILEALGAVDYEEAVYVVMGCQTECKINVANAIAWGLGATESETSKAGVRTFVRQPDPAPVLLDTLPFRNTYFEDSDWLQLARTWISMNSLKRLFGRNLRLVCVVNSTTPMDFMHEELSLFPMVSWLPLLAYIFKEYTEAKILLVNSEDSFDCQVKRLQMRDALRQEGVPPRDIIAANLSKGGLPVPANTLHDIKRTMKPFVLKEVAKKDIDSRRFGPWGPERVILFGRTGSGKSTIAQMLTSGGLDPHGKTRFRVSSSFRGATPKVVPGEGRGWYVVDTPGFGEPKDELGSTSSTDVAERKIKKYMQIIEGAYSHYVYVVKKDRLDLLEQKLWKFFLLLFGENLLFNFTVVITDADEKWVDRNRDHLEKCFEGCQSFVGVEFPPVIEDDDECEADQQEMRAESLKELEDELASRERYDVAFDFGRFSNKSTKMEIASITGQAVKGLSKKVTNGVKAVALWAYADFRRLISLLMKDNKIVFLPLIDEDDSIEADYHEDE